MTTLIDDVSASSNAACVVAKATLKLASERPNCARLRQLSSQFMKRIHAGGGKILDFIESFPGFFFCSLEAHLFASSKFVTHRYAPENAAEATISQISLPFNWLTVFDETPHLRMPAHVC